MQLLLNVLFFIWSKCCLFPFIFLSNDIRMLFYMIKSIFFFGMMPPQPLQDLSRHLFYTFWICWYGDGWLFLFDSYFIFSYFIRNTKYVLKNMFLTLKRTKLTALLMNAPMCLWCTEKPPYFSTTIAVVLIRDRTVTKAEKIFNCVIGKWSAVMLAGHLWLC